MPYKSKEMKRIEGILSDVSSLKKQEPNINKFKVDLKQGKYGIGLYAKKPIKKGNIIAYYKIKVFPMDNYSGIKNCMYCFTLYSKKGNPLRNVIGDIDIEDTFPISKRDIPFWGPFVNEPTLERNANADMDVNIKETYKTRDRLKIGDKVIYKLRATRDIKPGEEISWCYGDNYNRDYVACV